MVGTHLMLGAPEHRHEAVAGDDRTAAANLAALTTSPRQGDGVLPERGAVLADTVANNERVRKLFRGWRRRETSRSSGGSAHRYSELVFTNTDDSRFVLYPMSHPMHGRS